MSIRISLSENKKHAKISRSSPEDCRYVGSAPGLIVGGCHGVDENAVVEEICAIDE